MTDDVAAGRVDDPMERIRTEGGIRADGPMLTHKDLPADATAVAVRASLTKVGDALAEFDRVASGIAELQRRHANVVFPVATKVGMAEASAARLAIRQPRYAVEATRRDAKAPVLALGRNIDERARWITTELLKIEEPIHQQIEVEVKRVAEEAEQKRVVEEERVAAHQRRIEEIRAVAENAVGETVTHMDGAILALTALHIGPEMQEFEAATRNAHSLTLAKLRSMRETQAKRDAEAVELAALRAAEDERKAAEARALEETRRQQIAGLVAQAQELAERRRVQDIAEEKLAEERRGQEAELAARLRALQAQERQLQEQQHAIQQAELRRHERELAVQHAQMKYAEPAPDSAISQLASLPLLEAAPAQTTPLEFEPPSAQRIVVEQQLASSRKMFLTLVSVRQGEIEHPGLLDVNAGIEIGMAIHDASVAFGWLDPVAHFAQTADKPKKVRKVSHGSTS
jgi:hypothetical protein